MTSAIGSSDMRGAAKINAVLAALLLLNLGFWCMSREIYPRWPGVPPAPGRAGVLALALGDAQLAYRSQGLMLQNLGDFGNDVTPLKDYSYPELGRWFDLLFALDPVSDHVPTIAAYSFGATKVPADAAVVAHFLIKPGSIPVGDKWRWLAHAVYLAQYRAYDLTLALDLAYQLARMPVADMPQWARNMPAVVLTRRGETEAARELMENVLATDRNLTPEDANTIKAYLITRLGVDPAAVEQVVRMRGAK